MLGLGLSLIKGAGKNVGAFLAYIKDSLKLYYRFYDTQPDFLLDGSTSFDGTDDYIDLGASLISTNHTVSAWVYRDSSGTNDVDYIIGMRDALDDGFIIFSRTETSISAKFQTSELQYNSFTSDEWHHVASTYDGSTQRLYIDGSEVLNSSISDTVSVTANSLIGKDSISGGANYWNGKIANVGIWDRALSASEVESIYWRGSYSELQNTELTNLVSWYDLSSETLGNNLITNGDFPSGLSDGEHGYDNGDGTVDGWTGIVNDVLSLDSSTKDGSANSLKIVNSSGWLTTSYNLGTLTDGKVYRVSYDISVVSGGANRRVGISNNTNSGSSEYLSGASATPTDGGGWESGSFTFQKSTTETSYFKVMGFTATIYLDNIVVQELSLEDSQGSNNGAPIGVTTNSDSYSGESPFKPRIQDKAHPKMAVQLADGSTSFDGVDDYISIPDSSNLSFGDGSSDSAFSISAWVKMNDATDANRITKGVDGDNTHEWFFGNSGDKLYFYAWDESASAYVGRLYNTDITSYENQWIHICGTYSGNEASSGFKIYIDGSRVDDTNFQNGTYTAIENLGADIHIGRYVTGYHDGLMANVAIHSSELTQTQIQELMFTEKYSGLSADLKTNLVSWYDLGSETLGSELVTNGTYATGDFTGWLFGNGWSVVNEVATFSYTDEGNSKLQQDIGLQSGKRYKVTFDYTRSAGSLTIREYASGFVVLGTFSDASDSVEFDFTSTSTNGILYITAVGTTFAGTIDNVSIKEITLDDSEGTNHGSPVGTTTNTGYTYSPHGVVDPLNFGEVYSGRALSFDGTNDYIDLSTPTFMNGKSAFTISSWVNLDTAGNFNVFTTNTELVLGFSSGKPIVSYRETDNTRNRKIATNALSTGQWYHVAGTWDKGGDGEIRIYVNGSYVAQSYNDGGASTASVLKDATDADIGRFTSGSEYFNGKIQSVKVLDSSLTQTQVQELYTKPETVLPTGVSASNLKLDLPMQEGSGSYVYDGSGNQNHGTISGATWVSGQEYGYQASLVRSNTPMIFDSTDDSVNVGNAPHISKTFDDGGTVAFWAYVNSDGGSNSGRILNKRVGGQGWLIHTILEAGGNVTLRFTHEYSTTDGKWSITIPQFEWSYVVITYDSGSASNDPVFYLNGVSQTVSEDVTPVGSRLNDALQDLYIGNDVNTTVSFDGIINEVAIWEVALDADAVTQIYNSGVPLDLTSDSGNYDNSDSLVGYWRNDGNTTWTDRANTGVASFDSTDDDITVTDSSSIQNIFDSGGTISAWVYINSDGEGNAGRIMDKRVANVNGWILYTVLESSGNVNIRFFHEFSSVSGRWDITAPINQWNHLAITYDSGNVSNDPVMYLNGSSETVSEVVTPVGTRLTDVGQNLFIGNKSDGNSTFDGKMANVNVFNTALTATEVSELYAIDKRSSISGFSQFSNCTASWLMGAGDGDSTSTIQDQTSNNNNGTVNGAGLVGYNNGTASGSPVEIVIPEGSTEGRDNQGYYLSDTTTISNGIRLFGSEYIEVDDSEALDFGTGDFSIDCWIKHDNSAQEQIVSKSSGSGNPKWLFEVRGTDKIALETYNSSGTLSWVQTNDTITAGAWNHVVVTAERGSATGFKVYINGSEVSSYANRDTVPTTTLSNDGTLKIGQYNNSQYNTGLIDEVRIYKKVLSADEVLKNYNNGKSSHQ